MSMDNDVQTDAIGLDKCAGLHPILTVIFGESGQLQRNHRDKD